MSIIFYRTWFREKLTELKTIFYFFKYNLQYIATIVLNAGFCDFYLRIIQLHRFTKKDDQNARNIAPIYSYVFGVAKFESMVSISPSGHNFFLTSKTCFPAFIFFQAQMSFKNSENIHRSVFLYHKLP